MIEKAAISSSPEQTMQIAHEFAKRVQRGDVVALYGDLGAGKTHFVKGFATYFGINEQSVSSPTYSLIQEYHGSGISIYHIDAYRLGSDNEAIAIGLDEILDGDGISIVEWPERIPGLLPHQLWTIRIDRLDDQQRHIQISQ